MKSSLVTAVTASEMIDKQITELTDWRGKQLARLRKLIRDADPEIQEEWKWDTAVWSHNGMVCSAAPFKDHLKLEFLQRGLLKRPKASLQCGVGCQSLPFDRFQPG